MIKTKEEQIAEKRRLLEEETERCVEVEADKKREYDDIKKRALEA